jgi:membrane protein implicated in regulation of membrane protease activity
MAGYSGTTIIYLALLGVGILYAVIILIGAELQSFHLPDLHMPNVHIPGFDFHVDGHDIGTGAHDINLGHVDAGASVDHPTVKVPSLSPITIASFVTAFGAFGLIGMGLFDATMRGSLVWAAVGGLVVAVLAHFAFGYFLIAPQGSSEVQLRSLIGCEAEVITPIPADSVGEIAFVAQGGRVTYTAKSANSTPISRGTSVVIEKVSGGVAIVHPQGQDGK